MPLFTVYVEVAYTIEADSGDAAIDKYLNGDHGDAQSSEVQDEVYNYETGEFERA